MSDDRFKIYLDRVLTAAQIHSKSANKWTEEGNKFEFDVCDLLLKGAGGAIFFYIALLNIPNTQLVLNFEVLKCFSLSLGFGFFHKLHWSRICLRRAKKESGVHSIIIDEVYTIAFNQENKEEKIVELWKHMMDDEKRFYKGCSQNGKSEELKYIIPASHFFPWPIVLQAFFIFLGALAILSKGSVIITILEMVKGSLK